ncbi:SDR family oxidoreductase [Salipiger sp. H15]|uniref:SDR family oxidoreductase n=1 Tax=Alloyangia sp. H15 TaxID=3029062 RepID=A0AAU8AI54_9RHOB
MLTGQTIIVTGASSGIGEAAARLLGREGANVVLGARRGARLEALAQEIRAAGGAAEYLAGEVADPAYAAAKAGLIGFTQVLAAEHGPENIRVNALLPGGTMTEMAGSDPGFHEIVRNMHALKRIAAPEEIARAALFLLSDQSSFVTGSAMLADGGNSILKM